MSRSKIPRSLAMRRPAAAAPTRIENSTMATITALDFCSVSAPTAATGKLTWPPPASWLDTVASACADGSTADWVAPVGASADGRTTGLDGTLNEGDDDVEPPKDGD